MTKFLLYFLFISATASHDLFAEDLFRWTDEEGKVHFSNSNKNEQAEKAELPEIEKQNIEDRIDELESISKKNLR